MRVLITWGSKRGGTEGIARTIGDVVKERGHEVVLASAERVVDIDIFDAVIVGGAVYANRWPANVRRFVRHQARALRKLPVWFFSSGPLDDSADRGDLAAPTQVAVLAERVGALGHVTFGGRLAADAQGFPASAMAKTNSGDFRNTERIRAWADEVAARLPTARAGSAVDHRARSLWRLFAYPVFGWATCALQGILLHVVAGQTFAVAAYSLLVPAIFALLAVQYFRGRGAREPLATAAAWVATVGVLQVVVIGLVRHHLDVFRSVPLTWLPFALVFAVTWLTGAVMSTLPWPKPPQHTSSAA
jgi:menaquinone-dependent protoporphyrinogen oxidase